MKRTFFYNIGFVLSLVFMIVSFFVVSRLKLTPSGEKLFQIFIILVTYGIVWYLNEQEVYEDFRASLSNQPACRAYHLSGTVEIDEHQIEVQNDADPQRKIHEVQDHPAIGPIHNKHGKV